MLERQLLLTIFTSHTIVLKHSDIISRGILHSTLLVLILRSIQLLSCTSQSGLTTLYLYILTSYGSSSPKYTGNYLNVIGSNLSMKMSNFIYLFHRLHSANLRPSPPLLLHCPNGSEHCGLFLVLFEMLLDLIMNEPDELNVFELIQRLRAQRTNFIPTAEQYCFIYRALLDQVNRTDTSIQKRNFSLTCK